jgi:ABC-type hemin transport system, ATPase component
MLELRNISYRVGDKALLDRVSLEIHPGEVVAIVGANGAGKTTLTNILSGKKTPQSGEVILDGDPIESLPASSLARRRAVLPQFSNLSFAFTVFEVVLLGRTPHQTSASVDADICLEAMRVTGVAHLASREYPTFVRGRATTGSFGTCIGSNLAPKR